MTSCLTAIKNHAIKYCTTVTVYERSGKNLFWSIKNSGEILNKLKSRGFLASGLSTYDFCTLYTTLPHNLIKEKLTELIEQTLNREGSHYLACNDKNVPFTSEQPRSDSTTLPWSLGHTSHLGTILIVILVPDGECQE